MKEVRLLDCTLRDGGYVNDWEFGHSVITGTYKRLDEAGVDYIEVGFLDDRRAFDINRTIQPNTECFNKLFNSVEKKHAVPVVMIDFGTCDISNIGDCNSTFIDGIRVIFKKEKIEQALPFCKAIKEKGYKLFIQAISITAYSDFEMLEYVQKINEIKPYAFSIVDTYGLLDNRTLTNYFNLMNNNLDYEIKIGYHAHNNLQQAYSNAKYMIEQGLMHDLIIDASVFGMGRGAGNLNIELFAKHLNRHYGKNYNIEPFLEVFDECLKPIFVRQFWGYSLPFYLSSIHNCHPNYALFFSEKNTLTVKSIHELLSSISEEDKIGFSKEKAAHYYSRYMDNFIDDKEDVHKLFDSIKGRNLLILAPGKSISAQEETVQTYICENHPVVIGVNRSSEKYQYDYLFVTNEKRLIDKPSNVRKFIKTSNLHKEIPDTIQVNYSSYLSGNVLVCDNPTLMLLNLLASMGVHHVAIAGFDGFSSNPDDNYFAQGLSMGSSIESKVEKNRHVTEEVAILKDKIGIDFLTDSVYNQ